MDLYITEKLSISYYKSLLIDRVKLFFTILLILFSGCANQETIDPDHLTYWCWQRINEHTDLDKLFAEISATGFEAVLVSAPEHLYPNIANTATKYNIELHAWQVIMWV